METVSAKLEVHFSTRNATFQTYPSFTQVQRCSKYGANTIEIYISCKCMCKYGVNMSGVTHHIYLKFTQCKYGASYLLQICSLSKL